MKKDSIRKFYAVMVNMDAATSQKKHLSCRVSKVNMKKNTIRKFYAVMVNMDAATKGLAAFVDRYKEPDGFSPLCFSQGIQIGHLPKELKLQIDMKMLKNMDFDAVVTCYTWRIISRRLAKALMDVIESDDVELVPIPLYDQKGEKVIRDDFYVINALKTFDRSIVSSRSRALKRGFILDPILIEKNIPENAHIFRIKDDLCADILVIDNVVRKVLFKQPHDGLRFCPIETEY